MKNVELKELAVKATELMCNIKQGYSVLVTGSENRVSASIYTHIDEKVHTIQEFDVWIHDEYEGKSIELDNFIAKAKDLAAYEE